MSQKRSSVLKKAPGMPAGAGAEHGRRLAAVGMVAAKVRNFTDANGLSFRHDGIVMNLA
jgi:hypothetical protein